MKARRTRIIVAAIVGLAAMALVLAPLQVCRDWAFVDRNTGARKGYREWFLGFRTGVWYRETALETFMRAKFPREFRQEWISYAGTGRNAFGTALLYGHGRPGSIMLLKPEMIDEYCGQVSESENKQLYDGLASGERDRIQKTVDALVQKVIDRRTR